MSCEYTTQEHITEADKTGVDNLSGQPEDDRRENLVDEIIDIIAVILRMRMIGYQGKWRYLKIQKNVGGNLRNAHEHFHQGLKSWWSKFYTESLHLENVRKIRLHILWLKNQTYQRTVWICLNYGNYRVCEQNRDGPVKDIGVKNISVILCISL